MSPCTCTREGSGLAQIYPIKDSTWITAPRLAQHPLHHPNQMGVGGGRGPAGWEPVSSCRQPRAALRQPRPHSVHRLRRTDSSLRSQERARDRVWAAAEQQKECMLGNQKNSKPRLPLTLHVTLEKSLNFPEPPSAHLSTGNLHPLLTRLDRKINAVRGRDGLYKCSLHAQNFYLCLSS